MTDAEVTHRVEQAMLGAMMGRPRSAAQLGVSPEYFADSRHQAIAAALTGTAGREQGLFGRLIAFFTRRGRAARDAAAYMESLPDLCPDPGHIGTYFRMLAADRDQRAAAARADAQAQGSQMLAVASERLGEMRGRADKSTGMPLGVARLARALSDRMMGQQGQSRAPAPGQRGQAPQGQDRQQQAAPGQAPGQPGSASARPQAQGQSQGGNRDAARDTAAATGLAPAVTGEPARGLRGQGFEPGRVARPEDLEDAILAGLMHHPDEARDVLGWLPPQAFTGPRRELYTLIGQYAHDRRDIDPVTLAWGIAQANAARPADAAIREHEGWLRPGFVLGLGAQDTTPGAASVLGKALLADRECTAQLGPDWHRAPRTATVPGAHAAPGRQPGQAQDRQPAPQNRREPGNERAPQNERAAASTKSPDKAGGAQDAPVRQARPSGGNRPPVRAGTEKAPTRAVPGGLIQQPPPVPGPGSPSQNRLQARKGNAMSPHAVTGEGTAVRKHSPEARRALRHPPRPPVYCRPTRSARPRASTEAEAVGAGTEATPVPGALVEWHAMTPGGQMTAWAQLRAFVTWLTDRYELTVEEKMPRCWAMHPGLVEELWALRAWRAEIYSGTLPSAGQAARYWHAELERVLHAASTRYAAGCRAGHRGAPGLVWVDNAVQENWAMANMLAGVPPVDIAAGRAQRAGRQLSPEEMAAAYDSGDAAPVDGLRDYVQYGGTWWVPAASGWIGVPPPAAPAQANATRADSARDTDRDADQWTP